MLRTMATGARSGGLLIGGLLLASLSGCQWCPMPSDGPAASAPPAARIDSQAKATLDQEALRKQVARRSLRDAQRGQQAMVRCLQSERAQTDGNELRCEDWSVVRDEFLRP